MYITLTPSNIGKLESAKLRAGGNNVRLMFVGDSNTVGQGAGTGAASLINSRFSGMASLAIDYLDYHNQSMWADGNTTVNNVALPSYDSRVALGANWSSDAAGSIGGNWLNVPSQNVASSGKFKISPLAEFDEFELLFPVSPYGNNLVKVYVDGVIIDSFSQNRPSGFVKNNYLIARGIHQIEVSGASGIGQVYLNGIIIKDSENSKGVGIISGHCGGTVTNTITTLPYQAVAALNSIAPDFIVYQMTINDCNAGTALATYRNNVEKFMQYASVISNGVLVVGFPSSGQNTDGALLDQYAEKLCRIAADYGWGFIDLRAVFGSSWIRANSLSLAKDANHPNASGHIAAAQYIASYLNELGV
jgi:lysophospholipase L1-like esterase